MFKSKCKKIKNIDYEKSFLVTKLFADQQMLLAHQERLVKILNNPSPEILRKHMDAIVLKENAFNAIMEYLVNCFEFTFDKEELESFKIRFSQQMNQKIEDSLLSNIASKLISKGLIFNIIAENNNINLDDDEAKLYLDNYYKATNNSINDFLNNPKKFEEIRSVILEEKITQWLLSKFKVEFNLEENINPIEKSEREIKTINKKNTKITEKKSNVTKINKSIESKKVTNKKKINKTK